MRGSGLLKNNMKKYNKKINLTIYFCIFFLVIRSIYDNRLCFIPTILITSYIFLYNNIVSQHSFEKNSASNRVQSAIDRLQKQVSERRREILSQKISATDKKYMQYQYDNNNIEVYEDIYLFKYLQQINDNLDFRTKNIIYANTYFLKYKILKKPKIYDIASTVLQNYKKYKYRFYDTKEQLQEFVDANIKDLFNIDFAGTEFFGFNFAACWLMYNDFSKCDMRFSVFVGTRLEFAKLRKCSLWRCNFDDAIIDGSDFSQAELFGTKFDKITYNQRKPSFFNAYYNKYPFEAQDDIKEKLMSIYVEINHEKRAIIEATIFPKNFNPKEEGMVQRECVENCIWNGEKHKYLFIAIENKKDEKIFLKIRDEYKKNIKPMIDVEYKDAIKCCIFNHKLLKEKYKDWYV